DGSDSHARALLRQWRPRHRRIGCAHRRPWKGPTNQRLPWLRRDRRVFCAARAYRAPVERATATKGAIDLVSRPWRGLAKATHADEYVEHLRTDIPPTFRVSRGSSVPQF